MPSIYAFDTINVGQGSTPVDELGLSKAIRGKSTIKGDLSSDGSQATTSGQMDIYAGWAVFFRSIPVYLFPLGARVPRNCKVISATQKLGLVARNWNSSSLVPAGNQFKIYFIRRALSSTLAGIDWNYYVASSFWDTLGIRFEAVGLDVDPTPVSVDWTQALHDSRTSPHSTNPIFLSFDISEEAQLAVDENRPLMYAVYWNFVLNDSGGFGNTNVSFDNPANATQDDLLHSYWIINYRLARSFYLSQSTGTRALDPTKYLSILSASVTQHAYTGAINLGSSSGAGSTKIHVKNERGSDQPRVVLDAGKGKAQSVARTIGTTARLRYVRAYNTAGSDQTYTGTYRILFTSATQYSVFFTPADSTVEETLATTQTWTAANIIVRSTKNTLLIPAQAGGSVAWSGTAASGDEYRVDVRGDLHSTAIPLANLDMFTIYPAIGASKDTPDTAHPRTASAMTTQQLYGYDTAAIANAAPASTGVIGSVVDGGDWTHVKVGDPSRFALGWAHLCNNASPQRVVDVYVRVVYSDTDATYPGQVRLSTGGLGADGQVTDPTDFDADSYLTSGVNLGTLSAPNAAFLTAAASISSAIINVTAGLVVSGGGTITLFDPETGTTQNASVASVAVNQLTLSAAPTFAYPARSEVSVAEELSSEPFFLVGSPPTTTTRGRKQAYVVAEETALA